MYATRTAILLLSLLALPARTAAAGGGISVVEHSKNSFSMYHGDELKLEVRLADRAKSRIQVKWVTSGKNLCKGLTCEIDTKNFEPGNQTVFAVLYSETTSKTLRFSFNLLERPEGRGSYTVVPPLVSYEASEDKLGKEENVVASLKGTTYAFTSSKLNIVRSHKQEINWKEKIRIAKDSLGWAKWGDQDEHFFFAKSKSYLSLDETKGRFIVIDSGAVRSRSLQAASGHTFGMLADNDFQITFGPKADILVDKKEDVIDVIVLRGSAFLDIGGKAKRARQRISLMAGHAKRFLRRDYSAVDFVPVLADFTAMVLATTPEILDASAKSSLRPRILLQESGEDLAKLDADRDHILLIQRLQKQQVEQKEPFSDWHAFAKAYMNLGLLGKAKETIEAHPESFQNRSAALFTAGLVYFRLGDYEKADEALAEASYYDEQGFLLDYYLGLANFFDGDHVDAKYHLTNASWHASDPAFSDSADAYLERSRRERWLSYRFGAGGIYQSAIFGLDPNSAQPKGASSKGFGYQYHYGIGLSLLSGESTEIDMNFDGGGRRYLLEAQRMADLQTNTLGFDLAFRFFQDDARNAGFLLGLKPAVTMISVGNHRALDTIGGSLILGFERLALKPSLVVESSKNIDPIPNRDDAVSPVSGAYEGRADQSFNGKGYGLNLIFFKHQVSDLSMKLASLTRDFDRADQHKIMQLGMRYGFRPNRRIEVALRPSYESGTYESELITSKETAIRFLAEEEIAVNPTVKFHLSQGVWNNKSDKTEAKRNFTQQSYTLGFRFGL